MQLVRQAAASNSVDYELVHLRGSSDHHDDAEPKSQIGHGFDQNQTCGRAKLLLTNEFPAKEAVTADGPVELNVQRAKW
jgi:hypothetical protein